MYADEMIKGKKVNFVKFLVPRIPAINQTHNWENLLFWNPLSNHPQCSDF